MKFTLDETQNNRLLAAIFQELAVIVFDPQKEVVFANANMTDILGYSQEEIIGLPHRAFCFDHYAVSTDYQAFWNQLLYSKQRFQDKIIRKNKQGEKLILEGIYFPVLDEQQEVVNVVKIAFDITQREQALAVTIKKVQESAASLTRLSANGHQQVDHLSENLAQVKRLSDQNQATTHALEMDSQQVTAVLHDIDRIAQQTKLLSFNASIETARIGEQAAGFRVVADEMQKLAEQTKQLTQTIAATMQAINQQALVVLDSADSTTMKISDSQKSLAAVLHSYDTLRTTASLLNDEAEYLTEANDAELETT